MRFYQNMTENELRQTLEVWYEMFSEYDLNVVKLAVKNLIARLEFPPTIADVRKEIDKLVDVAQNNPAPADEWNAIRKAIKNSLYNAGEEFEKLPSIAKRFVGNPNQLRDWGLSEDFNDSVVRGQFLKQYDVLKEREKLEMQLTPEVKKLLNGVTGLLELE